MIDTTDVTAKLAKQHLSHLGELLATSSTTDAFEKVEKVLSKLANNKKLQQTVAHLIRDFFAEHIRPEIKRFAGLMELKLSKHDPARGDNWKTGDVKHHLECILGIAEELKVAVENNDCVGLKAADLANHAMMLADIHKDLEAVEYRK